MDGERTITPVLKKPFLRAAQNSPQLNNSSISSACQKWWRRWWIER
jgi:hypothetical protein